MENDGQRERVRRVGASQHREFTEQEYRRVLGAMFIGAGVAGLICWAVQAFLWPIIDRGFREFIS